LSLPENSLSPRASTPSLEIVIPVCNEEAVIGLLLDRLREVFSPEALAARGIASVGYVFVDDGSVDATAAILAREIRRGLPAILCRLSRNFGHQNAVSAGLDRTTADVVAVIDADLQDPPELILGMVEKWRTGFDVVYAQRRRRKENPVMVIGAWAFYRLVAALSDIRVPLDSGDFCLMDRRVVTLVGQLPEKLRFPRGLRAWVGFPQTGIEYDRPVRRAGRTHYGFRKLYKLATDGIISSSVRPLQVAQVFSVSYLFLAAALGVVALLRPTTIEISPLALWGSLLIISGNFVQVFCIYILGAYVGRTYQEVKGRPSYLVMEVVEAPRKPVRGPEVPEENRTAHA
jgi:dolichol-phosphate mannosyltransferase